MYAEGTRTRGFGVRTWRAAGLCALALLGCPALAHAENPANPLLFVTQVPMPEEVNSRTVSVSFMSCVHRKRCSRS